MRFHIVVGLDLFRTFCRVVERVNDHAWNCPASTFDLDDLGQRANLATQSQLGVLPKRRVWLDTVNSLNFSLGRQSSNWLLIEVNTSFVKK